MRSTLAAIGAAVLLAGCAALGPSEGSLQTATRAASATRDTGRARPPLAMIVREGDARGAIAVAVSTEGIAPSRGALVGVSLAALAQERLRAAGVQVTAVGGWNGWSLRALVESPSAADPMVRALRAALLDPVTGRDPA